VNKHRDFTFGVQVDYSKSQPRDDKVSERGAVMSRDPFFRIMLC